MEHETTDKFQEIVDHIGYIFNEKPEVIRKALQLLGSFDDLFITCLSADEAGLDLEEAIQEIEEPGSSLFSIKTEKELDTTWKKDKISYYVQ